MRKSRSQAFIELIKYIERSVDNDKLLFLLYELHLLYVSRLETLGVHKQVNKTRLKPLYWKTSQKLKRNIGTQCVQELFFGVVKIGVMDHENI